MSFVHATGYKPLLLFISYRTYMLLEAEFGHELMSTLDLFVWLPGS